MRSKNKRALAFVLSVAIVCTTLCTGPMQAKAAVINNESPIVIVLDAGHGGKDSGATKRWNGVYYQEKHMNLAIVLACKAELEKYAGVQVFLTRDTDVYVGLEERVKFAKKKKATLFVSFHNNADIRSYIKGASVYYPNKNLNKKISNNGKTVATAIQKELVKLGISNQGIKVRASENRTRYKDKSLADYYSVIRNSKLSGFPGIIIEHAYVSNQNDCLRYLSSESKLKKLGMADAKGIVNALGLKKGITTRITALNLMPDGTVSLSWGVAKGMEGYGVFRRKSGEKNFVQIAFLPGVNSVNYTDSTADSGGTYAYVVRPYKTSKNVIHYMYDETSLSVYVLGMPKELKVCREEAQNALTWTTVNGADGYYIAKETEKGELLVVAQIEGGATGSWTEYLHLVEDMQPDTGVLTPDIEVVNPEIADAVLKTVEWNLETTDTATTTGEDESGTEGSNSVAAEAELSEYYVCAYAVVNGQIIVSDYCQGRYYFVDKTEDVTDLVETDEEISNFIQNAQIQ